MLDSFTLLLSISLRVALFSATQEVSVVEKFVEVTVSVTVERTVERCFI